MEWESLFWKFVAGAGGVISTIFGLLMKSQHDRILDKDRTIERQQKQIIDIINNNERLNQKMEEIYRLWVNRKNGRS